MTGRTQQYLRSEYIQPPPGPLTLDAKKSPLALLAQTCSAIGKDSTVVSSPGTAKTTINNIPPMCNQTTPHSPGTMKMYHRKEGNENNVKSRKSDETKTTRSPHTDANNMSNIKRSSPNPLSAKSPVNVTNHYGAIINAKRQSPVIKSEDEASKARRSPEDNKLKISQSTTVGSEAGARNRKFSNSPTKHNRSLLTKDHETTHNSKNDNKKQRRVSQIQSPKKAQELRSSPTRNHNVSSPHVEKQDSNPSKSGTTTIPPPQTAYLMGGKTPPLGHKQHLSYPSVMPCVDRFCVACQIPHVPGGCDLNSVKNAHTQSLLSLYSGLDPMAQNFGLSGGAVPPSYASLQSQFMLAAFAARNEMASAYDATNVAAPHICNWVTATEGTCGKRFNTADELIEHLRSHALPSATSTGVDYAANGLALDKAYAAVGANPLSSYLNPQGLMFPGTTGTGISASSHLANVALANERLLQSSQRRSSPLYRYHPYKAPAVTHGGSYLHMVPPSTTASSLYCSPYSFYGQPVVAPSSGYVFP